MNDIVMVAKTLFDGVWNMLLSVNFPGTDISLAALSIAVMVIGFVIRIFGLLTGFSVDGAIYGRSADAMDKVRHTRNEMRMKRHRDEQRKHYYSV